MSLPQHAWYTLVIVSQWMRLCFSFVFLMFLTTHSAFCFAVLGKYSNHLNIGRTINQLLLVCHWYELINWSLIDPPPLVMSLSSAFIGSVFSQCICGGLWKCSCSILLGCTDAITYPFVLTSVSRVGVFEQRVPRAASLHCLPHCPLDNHRLLCSLMPAWEAQLITKHSVSTHCVLCCPQHSLSQRISSKASAAPVLLSAGQLLKF